MNTKIFVKIGWLFTLGLLSYLFFVVFLLSPKVNSYLSDIELKTSKAQFEKVVNTINIRANAQKNKEELLNEIILLLNSVTLGKNGFIFIFDSKGNIIYDPSKEFLLKDFSNITIPNSENIVLFEEMKKASINKKDLEYNWNKFFDPLNYNYVKISWIEYNPKLDWYIASSIYKDDFSSFIDGINSLILNISMVLFLVLSVIGVFITIKVIAPINKSPNMKGCFSLSDNIPAIIANKDNSPIVTN